MLTSLGLIRNFEEQKKVCQKRSAACYHRKLDIHLVKNIQNSSKYILYETSLCCLMFIAGLWRGGLVRPGEVIGAVGGGRGPLYFKFRKVIAHISFLN